MAYKQATFGQESMKAYNAITTILNKMENKRASRYWASLLVDINEAFADLWNQDFKDRGTILIVVNAVEKYFRDKIDVQVFTRAEYQERTFSGDSIVLQTHTKNILKTIKKKTEHHLLGKQFVKSYAKQTHTGPKA